ncbi:MAG: hypothetical protein KF763_16940 [Cyclobacteriaceae bacterium]|nr:hypothetical protein [Cyclobacteriaceae bacterium]
MRSNYIIYILSYFIFSCSQVNQSSESIVRLYDVQTSGNIQSELLGGFDEITPDWIELISDSLLLLADRNADPAMAIYSIHNKKKLATTGKRGKGPFEFISPKLESSVFNLNDSLYIYVSDFNAHILYRLNISKLLLGRLNHFEKIDDIHHEIAPGWQELYPVDDRSVIGNLWYGNGRVFIWDRVSQTVKFTPNFPKTSIPLSMDKVGYFYSNFGGYNRKKKVFASAMQTFKQVDFFDSNGSLSKTFKFEKDKPHPQFKDDGPLFPPDYTFYFGRTYSSSNFFFALCQNKKADQSIPSNTNYELYVFNWNQEFIGKWKLERPNLGPFAVSEKNKKLYSINYGEDMEDYPIIIYDLSSLPLAN